MSDTGAPTPPTPPALHGPPPTWVAGRGVPVPREAGRLAQVLTAFKAELLMSLGRRDEANRAFDAALALGPTGPTATRIRDARTRLQE